MIFIRSASFRIFLMKGRRRGKNYWLDDIVPLGGDLPRERWRIVPPGSDHATL